MRIFDANRWHQQRIEFWHQHFSNMQLTTNSIALVKDSSVLCCWFFVEFWLFSMWMWRHQPSGGASKASKTTYRARRIFYNSTLMCTLFVPNFPFWLPFFAVTFVDLCLWRSSDTSCVLLWAEHTTINNQMNEKWTQTKWKYGKTRTIHHAIRGCLFPHYFNSSLFHGFFVQRFFSRLAHDWNTWRMFVCGASRRSKRTAWKKVKQWK